MAACLGPHSVYTNTLDSVTSTAASYRTVVSPSDPGCVPDIIRVQLKSFSGVVNITNASIGQQDSGVNYVVGEFERLTFNGGDNFVTISSGSSVWSDWVPYTHFDTTSMLVHTDSEAVSFYGFVAGGQSYRKIGVYTDALTAAPSGYSGIALEYSVVAIEVGISGVSIPVGRGLITDTGQAVSYKITVPVGAGSISLVGQPVTVLTVYRPGPNPHSPCGHWHIGQTDNPVWPFVEQSALPYPYHEEPVEPEICGHWHKQKPPWQPCIEYVDEYEFSGTSTQSRDYATGEQFIYVTADESKTHGRFFYGCLDTAGTIFRFDPSTMLIEKTTTFADVDVNAIHQIIFYGDKIHALITRDGYVGKWIQKIDLPIPYDDPPLPFTLDGDPLYCGSVCTGTDAKIYGCLRALNQNDAYKADYQPITGASWASYWEELPGAYSYTIDTYTDYNSRSPQTTVGSHVVDFKFLPGVGYLISSGPESQFLALTSVISKVDFTGSHQITYPFGLSVGPHQMALEPKGSRFVAMRHVSAFTYLTALVVDYSTDTGNDLSVTGLVNGDGDPFDASVYHVQTRWWSNGLVYNFHGLYATYSGRIVAINPDTGAVIYQYWIGPAIDPESCGFEILGDYVYVWQDVIHANDTYSAIIKLTLSLEFVCLYDCRGLLRTNSYREIGGNISSDQSRYLYNFTRENGQTRLGVIRYDTNPQVIPSSAHDPRWPFEKAPNKF